jgi:hypothetical protein
VSYYWIKGHAQIIPNEIVDGLAKDAIADGTVLDVKVWYQDVISVCKKEILQQQWDTFWKASYRKKMTQYASIHPSIHIRPWHIHLSVSRFFYSTIARMKFGHCQTPAHLYRLGMIQSASCHCGHELADLNHRLLGCIEHKEQTNLMLKQLVKLGVEMPTDIISILRKNKNEIYEHIIKFCIATNYRV